MNNPSTPIVQIALDFPTIEQALEAAEVGVAAGVDILEAGTPLIIAQGADAIGQLVQAYPQYPVLADYKTMDSGGKNVEVTQQQGGHYMTVCGASPDETILAAIAAGKETGVKVVVDTIGVADQVGRSRQVADWGADMLFLHYGADQHRADDSQDSTQWLEAVVQAVSIPVGLATFSTQNAVRAVEMGARLVAIGHPLVGGPETLEAMTDYVQRVKAAVKG
jgi:3-hexulose-6-phosphate synthase